MRENKKRLFLLQTFSTLGSAMAGIFFPFLIQRAFGLGIAETIFWLAGVMFLMGLLIFPVNRFGVRKWGVRRMIQIGLFLHAVFYILLGMAGNLQWGIGLASFIFVLHLTTFWPSYHFIILRSTADGMRGDFTGNFQIIMVGVNLVTPILSGFLLEWGLEGYIFAFSAGFFLLAIFAGQNIKIQDTGVRSFRETFGFFRKKVWATSAREGLLADGLQTGVMWIVWPIFFKFVLGKFSLMGIIISITAGFEIVSSKVFGRLTDKKSSRKILNFGLWARMVDLGMRSLYMKFQHPFFVGAMQIGTGILGPMFNIPFYTRLCEIAERNEDHLLEFFIVREWILGFSRMIVLCAAGVVVYFFGEVSLGWFLLAAGLSSVAFRKF